MKNGDVEIGLRQTWDGEQPFGLSIAERRQHLYTIGQTGTGKSTLLRNMIIQDIHAGRGVGLIDPHGDLAESLLNEIPSWRSEDLVYFDPADYDFPIGLNLLRAGVEPRRRHLITSGIIAAFRGIWRDSWGPRLEYVLAAAVSAISECQNVSLLGVQRMLVDSEYRAWVLRQVRDPVVRSFWFDEFDRYDRRLRSEIIAPIQNKIGQLLMAAPIRNVLGQVRSKIDARFMMDHRKIFIANLAKGRLGAEKSDLLGALLVTEFQLAAMSRADVREEERQDFYLFVDEFQNFTTETFSSILAEARKYRLNLTLAHQYLGQLPAFLRDAVFGNVGSIVAFRVSDADARVLVGEFAGDFTPSQFTQLRNGKARVRPLQGGQGAVPFLVKTLAPVSRGYRRREKLVRRSQQKYATPRRVVEDKINRWAGYHT